MAEELSPEEVRRLLEEGRRVREEIEARFRKMEVERYFTREDFEKYESAWARRNASLRDSCELLIQQKNELQQTLRRINESLDAIVASSSEGEIRERIADLQDFVRRALDEARPPKAAP